MIDIKNTIDKFKNRSLSVEEFVNEKINLAKKNMHLNAFITTSFDDDLKKAKESDQRYNNKTNRFLEGIVIGIKDLFCTKNIRTTAGSKILENFYPTYESHVSDLIQNYHGAISLGKLNMDEFAMGSSNETSYFGNVLNPVDNSRVPGGSSGGSAAVVAANICQGSIGSDTGGSVRQPASFVGSVGIKPTYGRCSRYGMISFASSLDQAGVFANSVEDSQMLLEAISSKYDSRDSTSVEAPNSVMDSVDQEEFTVGLPIDLLEQNKNGKLLIQFFKKHFKVKNIELNNLNLGISAYYVIAPSEASSNLAKYDGIRYGYQSKQEFSDLYELYSHNRHFGEEVKRRILIGTHMLSAGFHDKYYVQAEKIRRLLSNDFQKEFEKVDFIITVTTHDVAFKFNSISDPVSMYLNDLYTIPASLAGLPAMSIPYLDKETQLPLGIHIIGQYWEENKMFKFAKLVEKIIQQYKGVICN